MMQIVAFVGIISMFFASIPRQRFKYGLEIAWIIICLFLAIRYDFGNDYLLYMHAFDDINRYSYFVLDEDAHFEYGWQLLCRAFGPLGFYWMVAILTIFECFVYYKFIKTYVPERYYWFSIFLFVFDPGAMLIGASMMRNMLAITLVMMSVKYIINRKILPFVILIFLASQVHSSAVILYALYLVTYIREVKFSKLFYALLIVAYMILSYHSTQLGGVVQEVAELAGEEEALELYSDNAVFTEKGMGIGVVLSFYIFAYLVLTMYKYKPHTRILFLMLIIGTFVQPFAVLMPMVGRYSYYFSIFGIFCYPIVWGGEKDDSVIGAKISNIFTQRAFLRLVMIGAVVLLTLYSYTQFFENDVWIDNYSEYHTIFEK